MSNHTPNRVQPGVTEGGQFATGARPESDVALAEPGEKEVQDYLDQLGPEDRRLAEVLTQHDLTSFGASRADAFEELSDLGGVNGGEFWHEAQNIASVLSESRMDDNVHFDLDYSESDGYTGYTVAAYMGHSTGSYVSFRRELNECSDDLDATGADAALAYARAIDAQFDHAVALRNAHQPPSMDQMRAAVQVDNWRGTEAPVRWVDTDDTEHAGTIRTGRWTAAGDPESPATPDGAEHMRITMNTGIDRFVPFGQLQQMVTEHRIAQD